jgi:hypothetical protein
VNASALLNLAREAGATVVESPAGTIIVVPRATEPAADELLPIADAARLAATSERVVKEAIRRGDLAAFGRQRDRAVKRGDLLEWIETRRSKPVAGHDDADIERRMRRLARRKGRAA